MVRLHKVLVDDRIVFECWAGCSFNSTLGFIVQFNLHILSGILHRFSIDTVVLKKD